MLGEARIGETEKKRGEMPVRARKDINTKASQGGQGVSREYLADGFQVDNISRGQHDGVLHKPLR